MSRVGPTLKKDRIRGFLPHAGETALARYKVPTFEYFMDYPDEAGPEAQTSYVKIAIYAERKC